MPKTDPPLGERCPSDAPSRSPLAPSLSWIHEILTSLLSAIYSWLSNFRHDDTYWSVLNILFVRSPRIWQQQYSHVSHTQVTLHLILNKTLKT